MTTPILSSKNQQPQKAVATQVKGKGWAKWLGRPLLLVLAISLAIHVLFLLAFGSVAIFKGSIPKLPFVSQEIAAEAAPEAPGPSEEPTSVLEESSDPFAAETPAESSTAESSAPLDMLTVVGGATWAPAIPQNVPISETGPMGDAGKRLGTGAELAKRMGGPLTGKQLFGIPVQAQKLGVIVDVSGSMQKYAPGIFREIFDKFPDADVILTNGGGMVDWETALTKFNEEVATKKKNAKERGNDFRGATKMEKPRLARFNTGEAEDWVPVRGSKIDQDYKGLKNEYPDLYDQMRKRGNTWFITSYTAAHAVYLAFEQLLQRKAGAIYWFSDFADPIEGKEAENVAKLIREGQIEVILHAIKSKGKAAGWASQVDAKFVKAKF